MAAFASWHPQLILMDHNMPVMSGDEAIRQIRRSPGGGQVKIIMLTASAMAEERSHFLAVGADDFITKPFRKGELFDKIRLLTGVSYLYAETPLPDEAATLPLPDLTQEIIAVLPAELRQQILSAATQGRQELLLKLIQQAAPIDVQIKARLEKLAAAYDYETLLRLFK